MNIKDITDVTIKAALGAPVAFLATKVTEYAYQYISGQQTEQHISCTTDYNKGYNEGYNEGCSEGYNEGWRDGIIIGASACLFVTVAVKTALKYCAQRKQPSSNIEASRPDLLRNNLNGK
ncbi:hypothetical protein [Wolbachia endosymbiont of Ctenocephalides felis wCfeT]|uniref:hypothetical protein n=1 Tax=Wolbachia endosymbiont of Ctenocephalides felis wCfeT TaxID=2732593 RepID=UPI0014470E76|nr:hypothetical protein [Wolbachia endosymbiont of Ctenocephalides felis wCfeT]